MVYARHHALMRTFGLAGVASGDNDRAQRWGRRLEWPMLLAAFWILIDWYLAAKGVSHPLLAPLTDWVIWLCFVAETSILLCLVDNRSRYLRDNWMNLVIILAGLPVLWGAEFFYAGALRTLRLALMLGIFFRISRDVRTLLGRHNLGVTLFISFLIIMAAGLLISGIDPAFKTPFDGIWWAWVTVTTVGYGDLVPATAEGRIFGSLLILLGIALFSMLTASFSVFFIEQDERELKAREERNIHRIKQLETRLERMEDQLERTLAALARLEERPPPREPD